MTSGTILNSKLFRIFFICAFFLTAGLFPKVTLAAENGPDTSKTKFDAKAMILEHISDSHSWPVAFPFVKERFLSLPVILYTDKGLEVFGSDKIQEEGSVYAGKFYSYKLEANHIKVVDATGVVDEAASKKVWDL